MNPDQTVTESGRIIAEFEDDAGPFATAEPEYAPVLPPNWLPPYWGLDPSPSPPLDDSDATPSPP
jgi:hypothetical protein